MAADEVSIGDGEEGPKEDDEKKLDTSGVSSSIPQQYSNNFLGFQFYITMYVNIII